PDAAEDARNWFDSVLGHSRKPTLGRLDRSCCQLPAGMVRELRLPEDLRLVDVPGSGLRSCTAPCWSGALREPCSEAPPGASSREELLPPRSASPGPIGSARPRGSPSPNRGLRRSPCRWPPSRASAATAVRGRPTAAKAAHNGTSCAPQNPPRDRTLIA